MDSENPFGAIVGITGDIGDFVQVNVSGAKRVSQSLSGLKCQMCVTHFSQLDRTPGIRSPL
jgi:hypothetical protein